MMKNAINTSNGSKLNSTELDLILKDTIAEQKQSWLVMGQQLRSDR
jgi:hypothetical protein